MYFVFASAGFAFATIVYIFLLKQRGSRFKLPLFAGIISCIGLVCGARLFGYAASYIYFVNCGIIIEPAFVFYGGLLGFLAVFASVQKMAFGSLSSVMCDSAAVFIPLFHFFGRIGCYLSPCCGGEISGIPVQLAESGFNLALSLALFILFIKEKAGGRLLRLYLLCYSIFRFFAEFFRTDIQRGIIGSLSFSQWISIAVAAAVIVTAVICRKHTRVKTRMLK